MSDESNFTATWRRIGAPAFFQPPRDVISDEALKAGLAPSGAWVGVMSWGEQEDGVFRLPKSLLREEGCYGADGWRGESENDVVAYVHPVHDRTRLATFFRMAAARGMNAIMARIHLHGLVEHVGHPGVTVIACHKEPGDRWGLLAVRRTGEVDRHDEADSVYHIDVIQCIGAEDPTVRAALLSAFQRQAIADLEVYSASLQANGHNSRVHVKCSSDFEGHHEFALDLCDMAETAGRLIYPVDHGPPPEGFDFDAFKITGTATYSPDALVDPPYLR